QAIALLGGIEVAFETVAIRARPAFVVCGAMIVGVGVRIARDARLGFAAAEVEQLGKDSIGAVKPRRAIAVGLAARQATCLDDKTGALRVGLLKGQPEAVVSGIAGHWIGGIADLGAHAAGDELPGCLVEAIDARPAVGVGLAALDRGRRREVGGIAVASVE